MMLHDLDASRGFVVRPDLVVRAGNYYSRRRGRFGSSRVDTDPARALDRVGCARTTRVQRLLDCVHGAVAVFMLILILGRVLRRVLSTDWRGLQ